MFRVFVGIEKDGFAPVFFYALVTPRGIEPRSMPSESATLSVELMTHKSLPR